MGNVVLEKRSTAASGEVRFSTSNSASQRVTIRGVRRARRESFPIDDAVFGYLQSVRALGRTHVSSADVARALQLPHAEVLSAMARLGNKGVRRAK
jgi:hypothetical protein